MGFNHIISTKQFLDKAIIDNIFTLADEMENYEKAGKILQLLQGKILASIFYEPSTRTRFSFETAMHRLGGKVITTESATNFSSVVKGETIQDTIKVMSGYADVIVLRHNKEGSAQLAADVSTVPVINAGDGPGEHPTQALLDIYTIQKERGTVDNMHIAFVGDLLYGRTVHSLLTLLTLYKNIKISLVSPQQVQLPEKNKQELRENNIEFNEVEDLNEVLQDVDVLYMTRLQKERFQSHEEHEKVKDAYVFDKSMLNSVKPNAIILHPLPRVNEISPEVDQDPRAAYFRQAKNGIYIRMALLKMLCNDLPNTNKTPSITQ